MAAECTSQTRYDVSPMLDKKAIVVHYTKAGSTDYLTCSAYGITTVLWACCKAIAGTGGSAGDHDPCTWATSVVTMTATTGTGAALVIGT